MLYLLIFVFLLNEASAAQIHGYGNTTAVYGGDAYYRCVMDHTEGLQQVTWQRLSRDRILQNLATYSTKFGQQINEPYREKVTFTEVSLNSTSITVKNLTWEDESCYICSFNVYPHGSTRKQTCLAVQGISDVFTIHVANKEGKEGNKVVFSCSATGKPAPTIQWNFSPDVTLLIQTQTITVTNADHTFTSSRNITLQIPPDWDGHVDCLLNSGLMGQRLKRIPITGLGIRKETKDGIRLLPSVVAPVVICLIFMSSVVVAVIMRQKRLKGNRRNADVAQEEALAFQQTS